MKSFLKYIWLIAKRVFWSANAITTVVGVITFFVAGFTFPALKWKLAISLGLLLTFYSSFMVWRDQLREGELAKEKLAELKNKIPRYAINIGAIKKYSVSNLITKYENQITSINPAPPEIRTNAASRVIETMIQAQSTAMQMYGLESTGQKIERLQEHVAKLKKLEDLLECTYYVKVSIKSTRSDDNVQIQIASHEPAIFFQEEHFINKVLPHTKAPSGIAAFSTPAFLSNNIADYMWPNIKKPREPTHMGTENRIRTKINHINADYKRDVFDEHLWIQSEEGSIEIDISIHSARRNSAQKISKTILVDSIQSIQVTE